MAHARTELMLKLFSERINKMSRMRHRPERHQYMRTLHMQKQKNIFNELRKSQTPMADKNTKFNSDMVRMFDDDDVLR